MNERAILEKLITTGHLNVLERFFLKDGKAQASILINIIEEKLISDGKYPNHLSLGEQFCGGFIVRRVDGTYTVYIKAEVSLFRFDIVKEVDCLNSTIAAETFLKLSFPDCNIDGVDIDW